MLHVAGVSFSLSPAPLAWRPPKIADSDLRIEELQGWPVERDSFLWIVPFVVPGRVIAAR